MPAATPHTSLAINLDQWRGEVGRYFGFGRTYSSMTATQQSDVDAVIDRGLRQFYAPPLLQDGSAHVWSFMRPTMNIVVHAPYEDTRGTTLDLTSVASSPNARAYFSATSLPTWAANGILEYTHPSTEDLRVIHIHSRASATLLELEDAVAEDDFISATGGIGFSITDSVYGLPTAFGGIEGNITLAAASGYMPVRQVSEDQIREMFLNSGVQTGVPMYFCVRPWRSPQIDRIGNKGQIGMYTRYELVLFPRADATYQMSFRYLYVFPGIADYIASGGTMTDMHPPGMAYHHETILASCLAVAEEYADSPNGKYKEYFRNRIAASVALDRKTSGSPYFGENIDRSDTLHSQGRVPLRTQVTYKNTLY
jgi:hypothetical protein